MSAYICVPVRSVHMTGVCLSRACLVECVRPCICVSLWCAYVCATRVAGGGARRPVRPATPPHLRADALRELERELLLAAGVCRLCACVCVRVYVCTCVCVFVLRSPARVMSHVGSITVCVCVCVCVCVFLLWGGVLVFALRAACVAAKSGLDVDGGGEPSIRAEIAEARAAAPVRHPARAGHCCGGAG